MRKNDFSGKMFIFTAPSGAGKTTIVRHLLDKYGVLGFSVSATTREKRSYETEGKDYYFITVEDFKRRIASGDFVEWEEVYHDQYYGTLKSEVDRIWANNQHLVFDIDVRGAKNIKQNYGAKCMSVFVRPPSVHTLIERLINRNTETPESLEKRINKVKREMDYENSFDIVLVNDLLEISFLEAEHIIETFINGLPKA
ncbi:MAG: guanylate kinase [Saprospiraceae bacterium]|jgi:guanylate kinase|nr:guanylate kinase [Saprospiraceae bacterium]